MSNHSHYQRQASSDEFMQSLGQLENVLKAEAEVEPPAPTPPAQPTASAPPAMAAPSAQTTASPQSDLEAALEAAAADIEQFMNTP
ncbi:hypothetical protein [Pseudanabaena sp. FACHB-2040]|uniref:hypothetical protein n=1 Tax=Pseudanabaena sp. FACHB-2040 TaxID=2692859 RepID=UPI00168A1AED|nr:hypothetical protein [Pseudanabaena sp. FACHB-2040]MBD2258835.1 hypothetical protein [Pseudanabaena sp. FACHB-2040]